MCADWDVVVRPQRPPLLAPPLHLPPDRIWTLCWPYIGRVFIYWLGIDRHLRILAVHWLYFCRILTVNLTFRADWDVVVRPQRPPLLAPPLQLPPDRIWTLCWPYIGRVFIYWLGIDRHLRILAVHGLHFCRILTVNLVFRADWDVVVRPQRPSLLAPPSPYIDRT